jgi:hypothetical protein
MEVVKKPSVMKLMRRISANPMSSKHGNDIINLASSYPQKYQQALLMGLLMQLGECRSRHRAKLKLIRKTERKGKSQG